MRVEPDGPIPCTIMVVGEAPGREELAQGKGFVGRSGQTLWAGLDRFCGIRREQCYVTNLVKDEMPGNRNPKAAEVSAALPEFYGEIEAVKPELVITAGGFSTRAVLGPVKMADVHGIPHQVTVAGHRFICCPIYHPALGLHNKSALSSFAYDLQHLHSPVWEPGPAYRSEWLQEPLECPVRPDLLAVDTEGWPDKPWGLQFTCDGRTAYVIKAGQSELLAWFLRWSQGCTIVGHNFGWDRRVLRSLGIPIHAWEDTMLLAYHDMLATGSGMLEQESQNLGTLAYRELGLRLGELADCEGVNLKKRVIPYNQSTLEYAGADAIATWRLYRIYRGIGYTKDPVYRIDRDALPLVEQMMDEGLPFDLDAVTDYYLECLAKEAEARALLVKYAEDRGLYDFNPRSHPQVRKLLVDCCRLKIRKRTKGGKESTNEKALSAHAGHPAVEAIQTLREYSKLNGTYLLPLMRELQQ